MTYNIFAAVYGKRLAAASCMKVNVNRRGLLSAAVNKLTACPLRKEAYEHRIY